MENQSQNALAETNQTGDAVEVSTGNVASSKKRYVPPMLKIHGTVEQITQNVGQGFIDFPQGSSIRG